MVSLFRFHDGKVDLKQRYAQTDKWRLERKAGHALFGAYRNPLTDDESVKGRIRGTANTNVMVHAGKLYAMKEDSPCLIMDPLTLETEGDTDFNGKLKDECLNGEIFYSLREAQVVIEMWRQHYNTVRPHSSLGYRPPAPLTRSAAA